MKRISFLLLVFISTQVYAQKHKLTRLWETDSVLTLPESALYNQNDKSVYVSLMGNSPTDKDSIGGVGIISADGKLTNLNWVTGLNSPKGLSKLNNKLYVADITDVVIINASTGKILKKIAIDSSVFLNDIAVDKKGVVYVSDTRTKKIHKIENDVASLFLDNIAGVNGLKCIGEDLYIAGGKTFYRVGKDKALVKLAELPNGGDGIEPIGNGDFLFSSWPGYIYYVYADGRYELLLDTHAEKINAADIGYDPVNRIVYVPTFWKKSIVAYKLD
ncbi:MAG: ATP-binding protein [Sphingobacteriaceae bacterium]